MARAITALLWTLVFLLSPAGTASARAVVANKTDGYEDRLANRSYQSERPTHILGCDSRTRPSERTSPGTYGRIVVDGGVATSSGDRQIGVKDPTTGRATGWFYNTIHQLEYIVEHIPGVTAASNILSVLPATQDYKTKYVYYTSGTGKGRVSGVHDAEGQTTLYTYTAKGQVATIRGTGQKPVDYIYDSAYGDLLELRTYYTFPGTYLKRTWQYEAASGLLRAKTGNSLSSKEEFEYYPSGALKVRENVRNARVTYTYTAYGDLKKIDYPDTATPDVTYTAHYRSGRPKTITDGAGTKTLTYDLASGGVTGETYTSGLLNGVSVSRGFSSGRLNTLSASWSGATIPGLTHTYSTITGLHDAITRTGTTIKAAYRYRSSSAQVTERTFTNGGGERLRTILDFNPQNQLRAISNQRGGRASSSHVYRVMDKLHRRKIVDREDGTQWHYAYNTEGELIKAGKYRNATEPLAGCQFRFTFDDASNREQRSRGGNATEGGGLITESYSTSTSDDIADQYTQVTHSPAFDILGQAGNPASVTVTTDISGTTTEQVDQSPWWRQRLTHTSSSSPRWGEATVSHALDSDTGDYYLPPGTETLSYDADGNLSGDARWTYTWDNQNRLIKMETKSAMITAGAPNDVLEFTYDGVNRRVRKKFIRNGSTVYDEYYLYDGWNITGRFRGSSVTKTLIQKYAWGLDASGTLHGAGGVGGLLWVEDAATTTTRWFPAYDGNGNVMALLEDNANSATAGYLNLFHEYGPFGESLSKRGVMDSFGHNCPFQFSTKWTDEETGLIYYGHRYYDPKHGRWLSRDPIGEAGGVNLYGFVGNDGVNRWDYLGLADVWTYAGINAWNPRRGHPRGGRIEDYVQNTLMGTHPRYGRRAQWNGFSGSDSSTASFAGTSCVYRRSSRDEYRSVLNLMSEAILNQEAAGYARQQLNESQLCCKKIRVLMFAPKTTTRPLRKSCCDFQAVVYWSPQDNVPNQRPRLFCNRESEGYWAQWGTVHTVDTRRRRAPGYFGAHALGAFIGENPSYQGTRLRRSMGPPHRGGGVMTREPRPTGRNAPDPRVYLNKWKNESSVDIVVVCHSQGCNVAMQVLNRGCRPKTE